MHVFAGAAQTDSWARLVGRQELVAPKEFTVVPRTTNNNVPRANNVAVGFVPH